MLVSHRCPRAITIASWFLVLLAIPVAAQSPSPETTCAQTAPVSPDGSTADPARDLTVFAAASLRDAFEALAGSWTLAHPGSELVLSFDSSSALRAQIEQGAPADVFASADTVNAQLLVDGCLAHGPITPFAGNALVIVVPSGDPVGIGTPADLARPGLRIVAAGPDVPVTRYAKQVIENLSTLPGYPSDFPAAVASNVVSEEDNVRAVLAKVELGEGDAAIVYVTDAVSSRAVESVAIPDEANVKATYAAVALGESRRPELAAEFLAFLTTPEAQAILADFGFLAAP